MKERLIKYAVEFRVGIMVVIHVTDRGPVCIKLYRGFSCLVAMTLVAWSGSLEAGHGNLFYGG
jgi:hypothetical protein